MTLQFTIAVALGALLLQAQTSKAAQAPEHWSAYSKTAEAITGDVTFTSQRITFSNDKSLPLAPAGTIPGYETFGGKVTAQTYRVTTPANPVLLNGNRLCSGPATFVVISKLPPSPPLTPALISMDVFSGQGSQSCAGYNFEAERP
jgi:hypothetical protein